MSNSSFRLVGTGKNFLSPTDFIIQVDTSQGAVEIVMPKIATILASYTTIYQYMGIRFIDISNNASKNNITLTGFETDTINDVTNIVLNTNGVGGILTLIGESDWSYQKNSTGGGSSTTPTLQQVLDFNHDLVDGNNFQGTGAGAGNTGTNVIAIGTCSAFNNTGNNVTASGHQSAYTNSGSYVTATGFQSAYNNTGNVVTATGFQSARNNTGVQLTASGYYSAFNNTGVYVTASGSYSARNNTGNGLTASGYLSAYNNTGGCVTATGGLSAYNNTGVCVTATGGQSAYCNTGSLLTASGYKSAFCNTGNGVTASGYLSAFCNTGCNVIALGTCAGWNGTNKNGLNQSFIVANSDFPTYTSRANALLGITTALGGVTGNSYFYFNSGSGAVEAVRL